MSRPFSYNDENFTVIGNMLLCHIEIKKAVNSGKYIVEIPTAIYDRLLYTSIHLEAFTTPLDTIGRHFVEAGITKSASDGKYYLISNSSIGLIGAYLVGYFILKDI